MSALDDLKKMLQEAQDLQKQQNIIIKEQIADQPEPDTSIVQKTANYLNNPGKNDGIPADPKSIESQRWNDPLTKQVTGDFVTRKEMNDNYGLFLQRIQQQMSTIGGGGEVKLRMLDDVDRSSIADGLFLKYQASTRKFVFASQEHEEPQVDTAIVTSSTYELNSTDSYIGVNYAGQVEITLPSVDVANGRLVYIKDESGAAEANPITVLGNVDNDAGGFTLQINNGSITLIYREGWRIV